MKLNKKFGSALAVVMAVLACGSAFAVRPGAFEHVTEEDFAEDGTFENTVINNYGELTLGREMRAIGTADGAELTIGIVTLDGQMYAAVATAKENEIRRIEGAKSVGVFELPEADGIITAISAGKNEILIATTDGKAAKVQKIAGGKEKFKASGVLFEKKGVENIWAIEKGPDGRIYVGTGPKGTVYAIGEDGKATAVLEEAGKNVIALAFDKKGNLIAGTDGDGLVIRAELGGKDERKKPFVLYEAGEGIDITALAVDEAGNIFAAKAKGEADLGDIFPSAGGAGGKSKPGTVEAEPVEDAEEDVPTPDGKKLPAAPKHPVVPKVETQPKKVPTTKPVESGARMEPANFDERLERVGEPFLVQRLWTRTWTGASMPRFETQPNFEEGIGETFFIAEKSAPAATKKSGVKTPKGIGALNPLRKYPLPKLGGLGEVEPANGVVKISADGNATSIFGGSHGDMVMSLLLHKGANGEELIIGTGTEGKIYSYAIEQEAETMIARVKEESITALAVDKDGGVIVGTSDRGQLYALSPKLAAEGTYVSKVLDATRTATFGAAHLVAVEKNGTSASVATRSGNVADVETKGKFWSEWSAESSMKEQKGSSPAARYVQYRVTLKGKGEDSPTVDAVKIAYASKNLPPRVRSLEVDVGMAELPGEDKSAEAAPPAQEASVNWEASDPNGDTLTYRLYYKPADGKDETWTPIVKDLRTTSYDWSTTAVPDGMYQVKVVASDALDNTAEEAKSVARVTPAFRIDHTPPEIGELKAEVNEGKVTVTGSAKDGLSSLSEVRFQVDGGQDWQVAKSSDTIFDSPSEAFTLTTRQLSAGGHRITVRAMDAAGNCAYKAVSVTVK
jgi:hypothetical protein